jgi:membrane-associated phospholipid phosphatase
MLSSTGIARSGSAIVAVACFVTTARAQARADSTRHATAPWVTRRDAIRLGVAAAATLSLAPLDKPIAEEFAEPHWKDNRRIHHIAGDVAFLGGSGPFVGSAAVAAAGTVVGPPALRRFAVHNMEAIALATIVNGVGKGIAGRALPGVQTKHAFEMWRGFHEGNGPFVSFPSGHTAAAFAMATTISGELKHVDSTYATLIGGIAFGAATAVGVARVVQRVHWLSDLPVAAVIGTWSGRVVQQHSKDSGRASSLLRGLFVGRDADRVRMGWSLRASDLTSEPPSDPPKA